MRAIRWTLLLLVVASLGCSTMGLSVSEKHGRKVDPVKLSQIVKGQSTMADVAKLLGEPQAKTTASEGTAWEYQYTKASALGKSEYQHVIIRFDGHGVVQDIQEMTGVP